MSRTVIRDRTGSPDLAASHAEVLRCPDLSEGQCRALTVAGLSIALAITWFLYRPTLDAYLLNDDFQWLVNARRFTPGQLVDISSRSHFYRPVVETYFFVVTSVFGQEPRTLRLLNVLLHSINLVLLAVLMRRLSRAGIVVAVTVLVFSTMPVYGEAVSWVSSVTVLLAAGFYLIALIAHLRYLETASERFRWLSLAAFVAAIGSHESAVTVPLALVAVDAFRGPSWSTVRSGRWWASIATRYWPFLVILVGYVAVELAINRRNYVVVEGHYSVGSHIFTNAFRYLTALYVGRNTWVSYVLLAVALAAVVTWGGRLARLLTILLLILFAPVLPFTWANASRYTYLPSMAFAGLTACMLAAGRERIARLSKIPAWILLIAVTLFALARFGRWSLEAARDHRNVTHASEECARAVRGRAVRSEVEVPACRGVDSAYRQALEEYEYGRIEDSR